MWPFVVIKSLFWGIQQNVREVLQHRIRKQKVFTFLLVGTRHFPGGISLPGRNLSTCFLQGSARWPNLQTQESFRIWKHVTHVYFLTCIGRRTCVCRYMSKVSTDVDCSQTPYIHPSTIDMCDMFNMCFQMQKLSNLSTSTAVSALAGNEVPEQVLSCLVLSQSLATFNRSSPEG